jgi:two-component system, OmpR family, sensor histidine kinase BaeS
MRSLMVKLTFAFVLVGLTGAILVAVLVSIRTRSDFNRFLLERDQSALVTALGNYYAAQGSWEGVGDMLARTPSLDSYSHRSVLVDANGRIVLGNPSYPIGQAAPSSVVDAGIPVQVNSQTVGILLVNAPGLRPVATGPPSPDVAFLERVTWATAISAGVAALIALVLGMLLARTLTRPLSELTAATQAMARGALGQRVMVRSRDEIGELATAFNQMSADLGRASQLRKQMTADLAHDLRTPLSILRGYTEGLQDGRLRGAAHLYTIMHGEVEHLQRLVEDLRVLSLADAGELPLNRRLVDPAALLERTGLAYIVQAEQEGLVLRVEAPEALPSVAVDTDRMTQVLNNLVSNALRYTAQGEIILGAAADDTHVRLTVRDTGSGIAPEDLPFVFERFYRADKARQRSESDTSGLGLAIAKALVEAHDGTISVESTLDQGTIFTITLPVAQQRADVGGSARGADERLRVDTHAV